MLLLKTKQKDNIYISKHYINTLRTFCRWRHSEKEYCPGKEIVMLYVVSILLSYVFSWSYPCDV